jgi:hypothetical protein
MTKMKGIKPLQSALSFYLPQSARGAAIHHGGAKRFKGLLVCSGGGESRTVRISPLISALN